MSSAPGGSESSGQIGGGFGRRRHFGLGQDFELNLASIIDCMVVLIAFVLISTSFVSIGIMDAGVAAAGMTSTPTTPSPVNLAIQLKSDHSILVKLTGKANHTEMLTAGQTGGASATEWNYEGLTAQLTALKAKWPTLNAATLMADNAVEYRDVVKSMEITRKVLPAVLLGGI